MSVPLAAVFADGAPALWIVSPVDAADGASIGSYLSGAAQRMARRVPVLSVSSPMTGFLQRAYLVREGQRVQPRIATTGR